MADLVAQGLQTKEVAARLFVSPKTVEGHLSRIYRKLGLASRTELAHRFGAQRDEGVAGSASSSGTEDQARQ